MWSDSYRDYVKQLVETNRKEYPYYLAHTCTYWNVINSSSLPTFKVYFSKKPITASNLYSYFLESDSICYSVIGSNGNNTYHSQRVNVSNANGIVNVDNYEFVYTNAEFNTYSVQPDLLSTSELKQSHFDGMSLILIVVLLSTITIRIIRG